MASTFLDSHSNRNKTPPKFHGFHIFAEPCWPITLTDAFHDNIRRFLEECSGLEDYDIDGMLIWRTSLVYESKGTVLPLYTVEENVERSDWPFCDYCRCIECEAEYYMEEFGTNPDIDEKPPIPLRDAVEKM